jgi:hypothetical protein
MTKVLLAVDEEFISDFKEHIERDNQYSPRLEGRIKAYDEEIAQAKADAQKMVEEIKDYEDMCNVLKKTYKIGDVIMPVVKNGLKIMNSSWKDRLKVNYTYNTIGSGEDLISFIENLLAEERKKVAEDLLLTMEQCYFMDMGTYYEISIKKFEEIKQKYIKEQAI